MASAQLPVNSRVTFASGKRPNQIRRRLTTVRHGAIDAAEGDADAHYINGVDKPTNSGVPLNFGPSLRSNPHSDEGENLYVLFENSGTTDGFDSDDPANVTSIQYADYDKATGRFIGQGAFTDGTAGENTTISTGGIAVDQTMPKDVEFPARAYGPVPTGVFRTYFGFASLKMQDDTA